MHGSWESDANDCMGHYQRVVGHVKLKELLVQCELRAHDARNHNPRVDIAYSFHDIDHLPSCG